MMADENTAPEAPIETPAEPVEGQTPPAPANDNAPADPAKPANDNAGPTEEQVLELVEKFGKEKALQILAKRLNYTLDGSSVSVSERAKFREERRNAKREIEEWQKRVAGELEQKVKESESEIEFGRALKAARAAGDFDQLARALGVKDWNEIQEEFIAKLADPNHKRLTELERKLQEKEQAEARQREEWEQRQRAQQAEQAVVTYKQTQLIPAMKESRNKIVRELADNPDVINMVYAIQCEHWDGVRPISVDDALERPLPGGSVALKLILKGWHDQLSRAFAPDEPPPVETKAGTKAKGKTDPKPAVAPSRSRGVDDDEWLERGASALGEAFRRDIQREVEERRKGHSAAQ